MTRLKKRPSRRSNGNTGKNGKDSSRNSSDEEDGDRRRGSDDRIRGPSNHSNRSTYRSGEMNRRKDSIKLEKFDGRESLEVFFLQFDNCSEHNGWDESEKLAQLKGALKDRPLK